MNTAQPKNSSEDTGPRVLQLDCGSAVRGCAPDGLKGQSAMARAQIDFDGQGSFSLPYPNGHFDCVVASFFVHRLSRAKREAVAREVSRVLIPGGELLMAERTRRRPPLMGTLSAAARLFTDFEIRVDTNELDAEKSDKLCNSTHLRARKPPQ